MNDDLKAIPAGVLLESVPSVLLLFGPAGELVASSSMARQALGLTESTDSPLEVLSALLPAILAVFSCGASVRIDQTPVSVGGTSRVFGFSAVPVTTDGLVRAVLLTGRDITERENLNQELRALERAAQVEAIVGKVSHELRNPLNAIRGYAQFACLQLGPEDPVREPLSILVQEVDRMDRMLTGLRDLGAAGRLELTLADPEVCLRDALRAAAPLFWEKGVTAGVELDGPLPLVLHDPKRLQQVFLNLLKNASEAIGFGGNVSVRAGGNGPSALWVEVWDDGAGVAEALGDRIFELFVTTKGSRGEGVGLAVCREIMSAHGGRLRYFSPSEGGTVFRVELGA